MGVLRKIEARIEGLFEGVFGRAFRTNVQPIELARKLVKEMDDNRTVSLQRVYVPNEYVLYLSPKDRAQFRGYERSLLEELAAYLAEHARREGYALVSQPHVLLEEDADLSVGEFGIATRLVEAPHTEVRPVPTAPPPPDLGGTRVFAPVEPVLPPAPPPPEPPAPERHVLVGPGLRQELDGPVLSLGRSHECDITLDDPSVSRRHAEIRQEPDGLWVVDLGSTNGTEVNGRRIDRARLAVGDRIALGQSELTLERLR